MLLLATLLGAAIVLGAPIILRAPVVVTAVFVAWLWARVLTRVLARARSAAGHPDRAGGRMRASGAVRPCRDPSDSTSSLSAGSPYSFTVRIRWPLATGRVTALLDLLLAVGDDHAVVVFGVLEIVLREHRVARRLRIARQASCICWRHRPPYPGLLRRGRWTRSCEIAGFALCGDCGCRGWYGCHCHRCSRGYARGDAADPAS